MSNNYINRGRSSWLLLPLIGCLVAPAYAADLAIVGAKIYASPQAAPIEDGVVLIHDGRVAAVGAQRTLKPPAGATIINAAGEVVAAGFWNSHIHVFTHDLLHADRRSDAELSATLDGMLNRWGFTTVFDTASILDNTNLIRSRIRSGSVRGPNILTVGEPFYPINGTPIYIRKFLEDEHVSLPEVTSIPDAISRERREIKQGADGVKLFTGDIVGGTIGVEPMPRPLAKALVDEAHREHRPVFAHPSNLEGMEIALDSGVDILAHTAPMAGPWSPALIKRMLDRHMALVPTLTLFEVEAKKANLPPAVANRMIDTAVGQLRDFHAAGGTVLFGTDVGYIDTFDTAEEYRKMREAGLDYRSILASLTTNPAERFGFAHHKGRVAAGMDADLVVLAEDPATDVTAFAHIAYTIKGGQVIYGKTGGPAAAE